MFRRLEIHFLSPPLSIRSRHDLRFGRLFFPFSKSAVFFSPFSVNKAIDECFLPVGEINVPLTGGPGSRNKLLR